MFFVCLWIFTVYCTLDVEGCGGVTHMLISGRARDFYNNSDTFNNYRRLLDKHRDALQAGSSYPDAFYGSQCFGAKFHDVSEDTHWTPFLNASVNYIRRRYPKPWDQGTEKLVVFLFGVISHQVADIVWHSLGIDQGFLTTMGAMNFHGSYSIAHPFGDLGGEFVSTIDMDADQEVKLDNWYIPTEDLLNIYLELYGSSKISLFEIEFCSTILLLESFGVMLAKAEIYPGVIDRSPFLVQEMENYFLGGLNDMVGWVQRKWDNVVTMIDKGTSKCDMNHNPLFVTCDRTTVNGKRNDNLTNGFFTQSNHGFTIEDLNITRVHRGINIQPGSNIRMQIEERRSTIHQLKEKIFADKPKHKKDNIPLVQYTVNGSYARFGWSMSSGDLDNDGIQDVVIGSPGYSHTNDWQRGKVYIIFGNVSENHQIDTINLDDKNSPVKPVVIDGSIKMQSRFGSSVEVLDINLDGVDDLVIGSPSFWIASPMDYHGQLWVYFGKEKSRTFSKPDVVVSCKVQYCNLGTTLSKADINNDGRPDLVIGTPYYTTNDGQEGMVAVLMASQSIKSADTYEYTELEHKITPVQKQPYAWFGHSLTSKGNNLMISSPNYRKCFFPNCSYSEYDIQSVGRLDIVSTEKSAQILHITGTSQYEGAGCSADLGYPYNSKSLVLAVGLMGAFVKGRIGGYSENIYRGGSVVLMNITQHSPPMIAEFDGNRRYGRFGYKVKLTDLNGDGFDDLIVTEPNRNRNPLDFRYFKDGRIYVFYGGPDMPKGNATFDMCPRDKPCAALVANLTFSNYNQQNRNGFTLHTVPTKSEVSLYTSDVTFDSQLYYPHGGRRSGMVYQYYFHQT